MLAKRIVPCRDIRDGRVVKGGNFAGIREVDDPVSLARFYNESGADELVFYDITATYEGRSLFTDLLRRVAGEGRAGVQPRAQAAVGHAVALHGRHLGGELIALPLRRGPEAGEEVRAHVPALAGDAAHQREQLLAQREIPAVDGIGQAVFQAAADEVRIAVAVDVGKAGRAVLAEFGVVVAVGVALVQLDAAGGGEAPLPVAGEQGHIARRRAQRQVGDAVAVHVADARGEPVPVHAEEAYFHRRGGKAALRAVDGQQLPAVGADHQIGDAVAV